MGNTESYDHETPRSENFQQPSFRAESSMDFHRRHNHQPQGIDDVDYHHRNKHQSQPIGDHFGSLDQVISALRDAGLESSNLILGIDFTKSNEWTGKYSFNRKSLHAIGSVSNPYEQAISIIGRTLSPFDEDNLIPCFGFGDASTHDKYVFNFFPDHRPCRGFEEALARYREIVPYLKLSGPTSFAPVIDAAIDIVEKNSGQYHVLVIIADGQVTRNPDTPTWKIHSLRTSEYKFHSCCETFSSLDYLGWRGRWTLGCNASIRRAFDNFQFVDFTKIMSDNKDTSKKETTFALAALMEIPLQYKAHRGPM